MIRYKNIYTRTIIQQASYMFRPFSATIMELSKLHFYLEF